MRRVRRFRSAVGRIKWWRFCRKYGNDPWASAVAGFGWIGVELRIVR